MKKLIFVSLVVLTVIVFAGLNYQRDECCTCDFATYAPLELSIPPSPTEEPKYTEEELNLLAKVVWAEAGSDWLTDEHQRAVASVIINRKNDSRFPNTIKDVVYQKGQYGCVSNGMINQIPNQRAYDNARYVLENGVTIPSNVVWQAQFKQGNGLYKYIQGHYFCY